jgi:hypothetical protein
MTPQEGIARARQEARNLLKRFGVESVQHVDVEAFAASLNVQVVEAQLRGAAAQLVVTGRRARILLSGRIEHVAMRRAAIAHELGHFLLEHPSPPMAELCAPRPQAPCSDVRDVENEANAFALELLTPARAVRKVCHSRPLTLGWAAQLSVACWVPIEAAAIRITELSDRMCAAVLCTRDGIVWCSPSKPFLDELGGWLGDTLFPGHPLDRRSLAWRVLHRGEVCEPGLVPSAAWLGALGHPPLLEHSAPVGTPGTVLTMLWASHHEAALTTQREEAVRPAM